MMTTDEGHPSTFALDVFFARDRGESGELEAHLATCSRCHAYVEELETARNAPSARLLPTTARLLPTTTAREKTLRWTSSRLWRTSAMGVLLAAVGAVFLVKWLEPKPEPIAYVGTKGTPVVAALIHRDRTTLWDGHSPLRAGDAIAFRVMCEGFAEVTVATPASGDRKEWTRAFDGPCPASEEPLGFTLVVDDEPGDERVAIVLRRQPMNDRAIESAIESSTRTANVFTFDLRFPKVGGAR